MWAMCMFTSPPLSAGIETVDLGAVSGERDGGAPDTVQVQLPLPSSLVFSSDRASGAPQPTRLVIHGAELVGETTTRAHTVYTTGDVRANASTQQRCPAQARVRWQLSVVADGEHLKGQAADPGSFEAGVLQAVSFLIPEQAVHVAVRTVAPPVVRLPAGCSGVVTTEFNAAIYAG